MTIARDISRQGSKQTATLTANQTAVTVTGGFSGSSIDVYLNGSRIVQGQDYSLNGTSGITLSQGASAGDIIEFVIRNTSNSGFSAADTGQIVDGAVTYDKLSDSSTESNNVAKRLAKAWVNFNGTGAVSIRDDFNVTSVSDNGTGQYTINFTQAFSDTNYISVGFARDPNDDSTVVNIFAARASRTKSTSAFGVDCSYASNFYDSPEVNMVFFA